jgi:hypothetical protein
MRSLITCLTLTLLSATVAVADQTTFELIGTLEFPGDAVDRSGLTDRLEQGKPHNLLGGFSAIEYIGNDQYLVLPDRGPGDGANSYHCRFHRLQIKIDPTATPAVSADLEETVMLTTSSGLPLSGHAKEHSDQSNQPARRYDPEGIRMLGPDAIVISDEYGPWVSTFSVHGVKQNDYSIPESFQISSPDADAEQEAIKNRSGRQVNGGFEGVAVTPSGKSVVALLQRPLIQDSEAPESDSAVDVEKRDGIHCRMIVFDRSGNPRNQWVYSLDENGLGQSEILAVNEHEFLVLERDSKPGNQSRSKRIYLIDTRGATDVSATPALPKGDLSGLSGPTEVRAVRKTLFLDLLDPKNGIPTETIDKKFECLTFGPTLADGRRTLIVGTDNDFAEDLPSRFYVYAFSADLLPDFGWAW